MEQYYTVQVATGETALPDFNYLIQYQNNYHATGCWKRVGFVELPVIDTPTFS